MSVLIAMLNGALIKPSEPTFQVNERGFHYGDGVFETMRLHQGRMRFVDDHWQRLCEGCQRLKLPLPDSATWRAELGQLIKGHESGVIKFVYTRGLSERGYRPVNAPATLYWQLTPPPTEPSAPGITVRWCETRLSRNALLAGIKHCNRLEQVLAQSEWQDSAIAEGLMLDTEGELVCGTMSNLFLLIEGVWLTPDLRYSGVKGVLRGQVLRMLEARDIPCEQRAVHHQELEQADEVFVCNAVRGIQPVVRLGQRSWTIGPQTQALITSLSAAS